MRDDFTENTKHILANRVCNKCSNPSCRKQTSGPQINPTAYVNVGVAAHISAASLGGKRYDSSLSIEQRKHPSNGIWLCQNCGKLVDNDDVRFTIEVLRRWKVSAEAEALAELVNVATSVAPHLNALSSEEVELLICAAEQGDIQVPASDEIGSWVSCRGRQFVDSSDPVFAAMYVEAVNTLCGRRLANYEGGVLYSLTGTGFRVARALKAAF